MKRRFLVAFFCICFVFSVAADAQSPDSAPPAAPSANESPASGTQQKELPPKAIEEVFQEEFDAVRYGESDYSALLKHRAAIKDALTGIGSSDEVTRFEAEQLLYRMVKTSDLPMVLSFLNTYAIKPESMIPLLRIVGRMGDKRAIEPLRKEYDYSERPVQLAIIDALGAIGDESVVPLLGNLLRTTSDPDFMYRGLSALAKIGDTKAIYAIESSFRLLPDGAPQVAAKWSLDVAKGVVKRDYTDTLFQPGRKQLLFYKGQMFLYLRPTALYSDKADPSLLVCVHGTDLNVEAIFEACSKFVKEDRLAVLAPFFDPVYFPEYHQFNLQGERSDHRLIELIDHLGEKTAIRTDRFYMFGHERGGEFVQRFVLAHPERIYRATFYSPAFQSLDETKTYPSGIVSSIAVPDLNFSMDKILATDFAPIVDPVLQSTKPFKSFVSALNEGAQKRSALPRYRLLVVDSKQTEIPAALRASRNFLFPTIELRPLADEMYRMGLGVQGAVTQAPPVRR